MNGVKAWEKKLLEDKSLFKKLYLKKSLSEECPFCGVKIKPHKPLDITELAFHVETSHGIPHDILPIILEEATNL